MNLASLNPFRKRQEPGISSDERRLAEMELDAARKNYRPTPAELALCKLVTERFERAKAAKADRVAQWAINLAFYRGRHWDEWEPKTNTLIATVAGVDFPTYRERVTDNQIPQLLLQWCAKQNRARHLTMGLPNDPQNPEDVAAADRATKTLRHLDRITERGAKRRRLELQRGLYGTSFLFPYWDAHKVTQVATVDPATGAVTAHQSYIGDQDFEVCSVWEIFPQPVAEWSQVAWCIRAKVRTLEWIRDEFPERGALVAREDVSTDVLSLAEADVDGRNEQAAEECARVLEYYEKPCRRYPRGRWVIVAGGVLLYQADELPHPDGEFPVIPCHGLPGGEGLWGKSLVEDVIPLQRHMNQAESRIQENFNLTASPIGLLPRECDVAEDDWTDEPGQVIEYTGAHGQTPSYLQAPSLPAYASNLPMEIRERMGMIAGINEVTGQANAPSGITAASAIDLLIEQDETRISFALDEAADAWRLLDQHMLSSVAKRYTVPRQIRTMGDERIEGEVFALMGTDLRGNTEVALDSTPGINDSITTKRERYIGYFQAGMLPADDPELMAEVYRSVQENELAEIMTRYAERMAQLQAQQAAMMQQQQALELQAGQEQQAAELEAQAAAAEQEQAQAAAQAQQQAAAQEQDRALKLELARMQQAGAVQVAGMRSAGPGGNR